MVYIVKKGSQQAMKVTKTKTKTLDVNGLHCEEGKPASDEGDKDKDKDFGCE